MQAIVYVDVDDTLVRWAGTRPIPIPRVIAHVRELGARGARLFCWSAAGDVEARRVAEQLGIADLFEAFLPKPTTMIDDRRPDEWRLEIVHPNDV